MVNFPLLMKKWVVYLGIGLFLLPLFAAGLYIMFVRIEALFRYDQTLFTSDYQKQYASPGSVAIAIEQALNTGDLSIFTELTGLRSRFRPPEANPNLRLMVLIDVSEAGYYQYLYFDVKNYHRFVFNTKQVDGRWVMAPQDTYYYLDSGDWLLFFTPFLSLWWSLLAVISASVGIFTLAKRFRQQLYGPAKGGP